MLILYGTCEEVRPHFFRDTILVFNLIEMVKTRGMITKKKTEKKKAKNTAKMHLNKINATTQFSSIEDMLKMCRPFTVLVERCNTLHIHRSTKGEHLE